MTLQEVFVSGLSEEANSALNGAVNIANTLFSSEVNTVHLMMAMLRVSKIAELFEKDTGIDAKEFFQYCMNTEKEDNDGTKGYTTFDDISGELREIIGMSLKRALITQKEIPLTIIYKLIMSDKRCKVWNILSKLDSKLAGNSVTDSILKSMPMTANFGVDYNALAAQGRFDPVSSRDKEIEYVFEVLGRRIKNNPCLVGEAGVGKTAIAEGMAQRLVTGNVPEYLKGKHIISVDISGIIAGAKYRGDFEERLNEVLNEAAANKDAILFFDEIHMLMGANTNGDSSMSAANILKPAISRGDVTVIGATTTSEYKKFVSKDSAFERRFQRVNIKEPSVDDAIGMVNAVIDKYNAFHNSSISDDAIKAAVILSDRYITDKRLPDKAITVIDETAAHLKKNSIKDEKIMITVYDIKNTVSRATGIDISDMDASSTSKLNKLAENIHKHVIGQDNAVQSVTKAIRRAKAGVKDPNRPIGSFLFVGPTGVGKTELTKALAIEFSGGVKNMIRFDMSEFMEKHSVSKLIGSPPGYVGYGDGGLLTEAIKSNPYSVVLFDEIEKAHPDVFNILLQVLDDGILTDGEGEKVDFKNCIIVMTSNAGYGADVGISSSIGFGRTEESDESAEDKREKLAFKALESTFRPEFLNRLDKIVVFSKLTKEETRSIVELQLKVLQSRLKSNDITINWTQSLVDKILELGYSDKYGARNIKRKMQDIVEDRLADGIINGEIHPNSSVVLSYKDELVISMGVSLDKDGNAIDLDANKLMEEVLKCEGVAD